jgi:hypothetical protein
MKASITQAWKCVNLTCQSVNYMFIEGYCILRSDAVYFGRKLQEFWRTVLYLLVQGRKGYITSHPRRLSDIAVKKIKSLSMP